MDIQNIPNIQPVYNQNIPENRLYVTVLRETYKGLENTEVSGDVHTVTGRVRRRRDYGNLIFLDIQDNNLSGNLSSLVDDNHLQLIISKRNIESTNTAELTFKQIYRSVGQTGDIIMATGNPTRSKTGELSLTVKYFQILTPCVAPHGIPSELNDVAQQDKYRSLHYLVNQEARLPILLRARLLRTLREFLDQRGFHEVDTGVLCDNVGANAKPFSTRYLELDRDVKLRVAPELQLKSLVIGGLGPVYEIGPQFRNEGRDATHNPEFTSCEFYLPYENVQGLMTLTEELLSRLYKTMLDTGYKIPDTISDISWQPPFKKIDITTHLEQVFGEPVPVQRESLICFYNKHEISLPNITTASKLYDKLIEKVIEPLCRQPTFLYGHPAMMSPLAQSSNGISQRFELFVGTADGKTMELCNAYSELRDPALQEKAFESQLSDKTSGDGEIIEGDTVYCEALKLGMPPVAGWGMGIERLVMLMGGIDSIRKVRCTHLTNL